MTINEVIFTLLKESLFHCGSDTDPGRISPLSRFDSVDPVFWKQVYKEIQQHTISCLTASAALLHTEIPEDIRQVWAGLRKPRFIAYVQMAAGQRETCDLLEKAGIRVAVMKGIAAAIYYPVPEYRSMGDVDLLVSPAQYDRAVSILKENGYIPHGKEGKRYHVALKKYRILYELHRSPAGTHISEKGDAVAEYILSGLDHIETNQIGQDQFPILPWRQNGMELIWHIRQHLYNGLGLRQIIDWMMFTNYMLDDGHMRDYMPDLKKCGLDQLAIVVTKMCQKYLGLRREGITWCDGADESLCDDLMRFIMEQGDFGTKASGEKTAKVLSGYSSPAIILKRLRDVGYNKWDILRDRPFLAPLAPVFGAVSVVRSLLGQKGGLMSTIRSVRTGRKRQQMFSKLYKETDRKEFMRNTAYSGTLKKPSEEQNRFRILINRINRTGLTRLIKPAADLAADAEYCIYNLICMLGGYRMPSKAEREYVRENVTFIYKSFERQRMAKQLCRNIQKFYPDARVIIADDSQKPLSINGNSVTVINLPFNSGLSYGINQALLKVETPYVVRMEDDCLLTRRTDIGKQLHFFEEHREVDLIGFGLINALRFDETPDKYTKKYYNQSMAYAPKPLKIPHLTRIDGTHLVLGKVVNIYTVRTEALRKIGFDNNIRMLDHNDFFYRAAGNIVSVVAEDTRIFHRHNMFDTGYLRYRNDYEKDLEYIRSNRF